MNTERIESILRAICDDANPTIKITKSIQLEEATLYHFDFGYGRDAACIVYDDGTLFHLNDWQSGAPQTAEEVEDYDWDTADGRSAIILNGLPRIF